MMFVLAATAVCTCATIDGTCRICIYSFAHNYVILGRPYAGLNKNLDYSSTTIFPVIEIKSIQ